MSFILAINSGINSSVGLFRDGHPVICVEEERFNRVKNWFGFPEKALAFLMKQGYFQPSELTDIAVCDSMVGNTSRDSFYQRYQNHYRAGKALAFNANNEQLKARIKTSLKSTGFYKIYHTVRARNADKLQYNNELRDRLVSMGFDASKIIHVEHHLCHASSAYYGMAKGLEDKYLIFTLDGGGDGLKSTVSIGSNGVVERQSATAEYSIGNIYSATTHYLGFTPHEHEYKLMGLAPYVNPKYADKYRNFFDEFLRLSPDETKFENPYFINHTVFFSKIINKLDNARFDNIAAGLQSFTEDIVVRWVRANVRKYKINKILCAGGVFMNVKLNMLLSQLPEVEFIDVFPSCGDESNIFGAAFSVHNSRHSKAVSLLSKYTLGTTPSADLEEALSLYAGQVAYQKHSDINQVVAQRLSEHKIVARCSGNMEFGARALGNRSIMANPSNMQNINRINQSVKKRDFWMPFAPAMLWEEAETMIKIPASVRQQGSPYMMFAFETVKDASDKIVCGIHQADFTARAETITADRYPEFHDIIRKFRDITGIPCVLNTSFNLHGFPIVENSRQAIEVLLNSEIDTLVIDDYTIERKQQ
jgi:carbamoyltransferase